MHVSPTWTIFARENDGSAALPENVLGRVLWTQINDHTAVDIYQRLVRLARAGRPTSFEYRCDAPEWRRVFRMSITADTNGNVEFSSVLLSQSRRPAIRLLASDQVRDQRLVRLCSWCHALVVGNEWLPLEIAVNRVPLLAGDTLPRITHGICPACAANYFPLPETADPAG